MRALAPGHRKQLRHEVLAGKEGNLAWDTISLQSDPAQSSFERQVPRIWRSGPMLRLYRWMYAIRNARNYDVVLLRTISLDVFGPLLGPFVPNRVTVHHAKEVEELAILDRGAVSKKIATLIERYITPVSMKTARGLAGVTNDIRDYEVARFPHLKKRAIVFPNGYHYAETKPAEDKRTRLTVTFTFICATFAEWHGLDRLLEAIRIDSGKTQKRIKIHLVGSLSNEQRATVNAVSHERVEVVAHDVLDSDEISPLLASTDVAVGSLALDRKNLVGASTLKVREYLASGIPVYATHSDTALPQTFPFYYSDTTVSLDRMVSFAESMTEYSREDIREASKPYLDKKIILERAMQQLSEMKNQS